MEHVSLIERPRSSSIKPLQISFSFSRPDRKCEIITESANSDHRLFTEKDRKDAVERIFRSNDMMVLEK